jgi:acylaminoacyl-peptidase
VVYVAEAKESLVATDKFKFMPHLGEGLSGKKRPTMFVFRWDSSSLHARASTTAISPIVSSPVLFGQPVFSRLDKHKIFATGYEYTRDGRLLGLRWCYNRPAGIWEITLPSSEGGAAEALDCIAQKLTASDLSCRSPRISPNGKLFWLSHASAGPHAGTFSLHSCDVVSSERMAKILVETVWEPRSSDGFPGLYPSANLPTASFLRLHQDHDYLVVDSVWGSRTTVLLIAVADGAVKDLTPDSDGLLYSWKVLATDGKARILCSRSAPSIPHELVLGEFTIPESVSWRVVYKPYVAPGGV